MPSSAPSVRVSVHLALRPLLLLLLPLLLVGLLPQPVSGQLVWGDFDFICNASCLIAKLGETGINVDAEASRDSCPEALNTYCKDTGYNQVYKEYNADGTTVATPDDVAFGNFSSCYTCPDGYIAWSSWDCIPCPGGWIHNKTAEGTFCEACAAGSYSLPATTTCIDCPAGFYTGSDGSAACIPCPTSTYTTAGGSTCSLCPAGKFSASGELTQEADCTNCPQGSHTPSGGLSGCLACPQGLYAPSPGASVCDVCQPGLFRGASEIADTFCHSCSAGLWSYRGFTSCATCSAGRFSNTTAASTCQTCPVNTYISTPSHSVTVCTNCPAGKEAYGGATTDADCHDCNKGMEGSVAGAGCTPCAAGSYKTSAGTGSCTALATDDKFFFGEGAIESTGDQCPRGRAADAAHTACLNCPIGKASGDDATTANAVGWSCTDCIAGLFGPGEGLPNCLYCPQGWYRDGASGVNCTACSAGKFSENTPSSVLPVSEAAACNDCPIGTYAPIGGAQSSTGCIDCQRGRFTNETGLTVCTECAAGDYRDVADPSKTVCTGCDVGLFSSTPGRSICEQCYPGRYTDATGQTSATFCPAGRFSNLFARTALANCGSCAAGTFTPIQGLTACVSCHAGRHQSAAHTSSDCGLCAPGFMSTAVGSTAAACTPCVAGYYSTVEGSLSCHACPPGTYQGASGQTFCSNCTAGESTAGADAATSCTPCTGNTYTSFDAEPDCLPCPQGTLHENNTQCTLCGDRFIAKDLGDGSFGCEECAVGKVATVDASDNQVCDSCLAGTYQSENLCTPCGINQYQPDNETTVGCTGCSTGTGCIPCARGLVASGSASACTLCSIGKFEDTTSDPAVCTTCQLNRFQNEEGKTQCEDCVQGLVRDSSRTACTECPTGRYHSAQVDEFCTVCPSNEFSNTTGSTTCTTCADGSVASVAGSTVCTACSDGQYDDATTTTCQACTENTYSASGDTACTACPSGELTQRFTACVACAAGKSLNLTVTTDPTCSSCTAGRFANTTSLTDCYDCPAGYINSRTAATTCSLCGTGRFADTAGLSVCTSCSGNTAETADRTTCDQCSLGLIANSLRDGCDQCALGKFHDAATDSVCTDCTSGYFANETGLSACYACDAGLYTDRTGQTVCTQCPLGTYCPTAALSNPVACPDGENVVAETVGLTACVACTHGLVSDSFLTCTDCQAGTYHEDVSNTSCSNCPEGYISAAPAATACDACAAGAFARRSGLTECTLCAEGRFTDVPGLSVCSDCNGNTFANETGLSACFDCDVGTITQSKSCQNCSSREYHAAQADTFCTACEAGSFQDAEGSSACHLCSVGLFQASIEALSCDTCTAGLFSDATGATFCDTCNNNTFSPVSASACVQCAHGEVTTGDECSPCAAGSFHTDLDATFCTLCSAGLFSSTTGWTACSECIPGYISGAGATVCTACARGSFSEANASTVCTACAGYLGSSNYHAEDEASTACLLCPLGEYTLGHITCETCSRGYFHEDQTSTVCVECATGKFAESFGSTICADCGLGKFAGSVLSSVCSDCSAGLQGNTTGLSACYDCEGNTVTGSSETVCSLCDAGTISKSFRSCDKCGTGRFHLDQTDTACTSCAAGTFQNETGMTFCHNCSAGRFLDTSGRSSCRECPAGRFMADEGATVCYTCGDATVGRDNPNEISAAAASTCTACNHGNVASSAKLTCSAVPKGKYHASASDTFATDCTVGFHGPELALTVCAACAAGFYTDLASQEDCRECSLRTYQPSQAQTACLDCTNNTFAGLTASTACTECPGGELTTGTSCTACQAWEFVNVSSTGDVSCQGCPTINTDGSGGTRYRTLEGLLGNDTYEPCEECSAGKFVSLDSPFTCQDCAGGEYMPPNETETSSCRTCDLSSVSTADHTGCEICGVGTYMSTSRDQCLECADGSIAPTVSTRECTGCVSGFFENGTHLECLTCPPSGLDCSAGVIDVWEGVWWNNEGFGTIGSETVFHECFFPDACDVNQTSQDVTCATGYDPSVPLCAVCSKSEATGGMYYQHYVTAECIECGLEAYLSLALAVASVFCWLGWSAYMTNLNLKISDSNPVDLLSPLIRIGIGYFSGLVVLGMFELDPPDPAGGFIWYARWVPVNPAAALFFSMRCLAGWTWRNEFYAYLLLPIVLAVAAPLISWLVRHPFKRCCQRRHIRPSYLFGTLYYACLQQLSIAMLASFNVYPLEVCDGTNCERYLFFDFLVTTSTKGWFNRDLLLQLSIVGIALYLIIPVFAFVLGILHTRTRLIASKRHPLKPFYAGFDLGSKPSLAVGSTNVPYFSMNLSRCPIRVDQTTRPHDFVPERWYWEVVTLARTLFLASLVTNPRATATPFLQAYLGVLVLAFFLCLQLIGMPFQHPLANLAETAALITQVVCLAASLIAEEYKPGLGDDNFGTQSNAEVGTAYLIIFLTSVTGLFLVVLIVWAATCSRAALARRGLLPPKGLTKPVPQGTKDPPDESKAEYEPPELEPEDADRHHESKASPVVAGAGVAANPLPSAPANKYMVGVGLDTYRTSIPLAGKGGGGGGGGVGAPPPPVARTTGGGPVRLPPLPPSTRSTTPGLPGAARTPTPPTAPSSSPPTTGVAQARPLTEAERRAKVLAKIQKRKKGKAGKGPALPKTTVPFGMDGRTSAIARAQDASATAQRLARVQRQTDPTARGSGDGSTVRGGGGGGGGSSTGDSRGSSGTRTSARTTVTKIGNRTIMSGVGPAPGSNLYIG